MFVKLAWWWSHSQVHWILLESFLSYFQPNYCCFLWWSSTCYNAIKRLRLGPFCSPFLFLSPIQRVAVVSTTSTLPKTLDAGMIATTCASLSHALLNSNAYLLCYKQQDVMISSWTLHCYSARVADILGSTGHESLRKVEMTPVVDYLSLGFELGTRKIDCKL